MVDAAVRQSNGGGMVPCRRLADRVLVGELRNGEAAALGRLYDRYAPLVFTLAHDGRSRTPEAITEDVFVDLWHMGTRALLPLPILPVLLDLTRQRVLPAGGTLPTLAGFRQFPAFVFDVMVLSRLGQLDLTEIATALDVDRREVCSAVGAGLSRLRSAAPAGVAMSLHDGA